MAVIVHIALLLLFMLCSDACKLVPSNYGSCFELKATQKLTYNSTQFGPKIEGPGVNQAGDMFAVEYGDVNTKYQLGQFTPRQRLFYNDTNKASYFAGLKFLNFKAALTVDSANHRILRLNVAFGNVVTSSEVFCSNSSMLQPNDLTISKTGSVFASGFNNSNLDSDGTDGDIWACLPDRTAKRLELLSRTNGIELSPDDRYLYVTEALRKGGVAYSQVIWRYNANVREGSISNKVVFVNVTLDDPVLYEIDGIRADILGNIFVTRRGASRIDIFSPDRNLIGKIGLNFPNPTNLEFGGRNGRTLYIVGECVPAGKGCIDQIEVATPGRSWAQIQEPRFSF